jgi:hypothetical protein
MQVQGVSRTGLKGRNYASSLIRSLTFGHETAAGVVEFFFMG